MNEGLDYADLDEIDDYFRSLRAAYRQLAHEQSYACPRCGTHITEGTLGVIPDRHIPQPDNRVPDPRMYVLRCEDCVQWESFDRRDVIDLPPTHHHAWRELPKDVRDEAWDKYLDGEEVEIDAESQEVVSSEPFWKQSERVIEDQQTIEKYEQGEYVTMIGKLSIDPDDDRNYATNQECPDCRKPLSDDLVCPKHGKIKNRSPAEDVHLFGTVNLGYKVVDCHVDWNFLSIETTKLGLDEYGNKVREPMSMSKEKWAGAPKVLDWTAFKDWYDGYYYFIAEEQDGVHYLIDGRVLDPLQID